MRIDSLTLTNFKCFAERTFSLGPRFTLFIGDNGKGKTAVLDALTVGAGAWLLGFPGVPTRPISRSEVRRVSYLHDDIATLEPQTPCVVSCEGEVAGRRIEWRRELRAPTPAARTTWRDAKSIGDLARASGAQMRAGGDMILPVVSYYGTGRLWVQRQSRPPAAFGRGSRVRGYQDCLDPRSDAKQLISWFKTYEFSAHQRERRSEALEAVRQAVLACIPDARRLYYDPLGEDDLMLEVESQALPFSLLSDGYRNMLGMVADIAWRAATLNPHLKGETVRETPGVVLIDEVDLHLHPKWQRLVVGALLDTFPRIQFVGTTHSPFIIQSVERRDGVELVNLDGLDTQVESRSIEEIAEENQGVEGVERSQRFQQMLRAAEEYYQVLDRAKTAAAPEVEDYKRRLDKLLEPYADDPAYAALLRMQRIGAGLNGEEQDASR